MPSRILLLSGMFPGGPDGGVVPPGLHPPFDNSWARVGGNPVLTADEGWDGNWVLEPTVLYEGGLFKMIYTGDNGTGGSFNSEQFGYAESADGITWTKHGSPVFGGGVGGESDYVNQPTLYKDGSTYRLYYRSPVNYLCIATSTDLLTWSVFDTNIIGNPDGQTEWDNTTIIVDTGGTWHMIAEGFKTPIYRLYYWTSADGLTWTAGNGGAELVDLQVASGGMYGGPFLWPEQIAGEWHLWYHAAPGSGLLPTNIYHASSPDFVNWTQTGMVLAYGVDGFEVDQVADPCILVVGSTAYMFYDGDDNTLFEGAIGLATASAI